MPAAPDGRYPDPARVSSRTTVAHLQRCQASSAAAINIMPASGNSGRSIEVNGVLTPSPTTVGELPTATPGSSRPYNSDPSRAGSPTPTARHAAHRDGILARPHWPNANAPGAVKPFGPWLTVVGSPATIHGWFNRRSYNDHRPSAGAGERSAHRADAGAGDGGRRRARGRSGVDPDRCSGAADAPDAGADDWARYVTRSCSFWRPPAAGGDRGLASWRRWCAGRTKSGAHGAWRHRRDVLRLTVGHREADRVGVGSESRCRSSGGSSRRAFAWRPSPPRASPRVSPVIPAARRSPPPWA
jgi:hypothetical protein